MLVHNLAAQFGTLAESVELFLAIAFMLLGIWLTHLVQRWADKTGVEDAGAVNLGKANPVPREPNTMRD